MIDDNSLLISKIKDKIDIAKSKNKIAYTDFLQLYPCVPILSITREHRRDGADGLRKRGCCKMQHPQ